MRTVTRNLRKTLPVFALVIGLLLVAACSNETETPTDPGNDAGAPATETTAAAPADSECSTETPEASTKTQHTAPFDMTIDPKKSYTATMETSCGTIVIALTPEKTPGTVNNFVNLAEEGWYDGSPIHRISGGIDIIQGGDAMCATKPDTCGTGGPGYAIKDELSGNERYVEGVVAMANAGPDTGGSQFFIVTGPAGAVLQPDYAVFATVTEGIEVAQAIQAQPVGGMTGETPVTPIWVNSVTIQES